MLLLHDEIYLRSAQSSAIESDLVDIAAEESCAEPAGFVYDATDRHVSNAAGQRYTDALK